jgi:type I restriction enzyme S subunit
MESTVINIERLRKSRNWSYTANSKDVIWIDKKLSSSKYSVVSLGDFIISLTGGLTPKGARYAEQGIMFIRVGNIQASGLNLSEVVYIEETLHKGELKRCQLQPNDVLLAITGATFGKACVFPEGYGEANINQHIVRIRTSSDITPYYLYIFLNSELGKKQSQSLATGGTRPALDYKAIRAIQIPLPPRSLQDQIAQVMQEAYGARKIKLKQAEELAHEISNHIPDVLDIHVSSSKNERSFVIKSSSVISKKRWDFDYFEPKYQDIINQIINSRWDVKHLSEVISVLTDGQHGYLKHLPSGVPLLRTTNVFENEIRLDSVRYIAPEVHAELKRSQLQTGDILLTTIGSIGVAAVVDESLGEANINQNLVKLTPNSNINPYYLASFLNSSIGRIQTERTASKSVVPIVSYPRLRNILIPVPPRSIQDDVEKYMRNTLLKIRSLRSQAEAVVTAAKARVERMILGEEVSDG